MSRNKKILIGLAIFMVIWVSNDASGAANFAGKVKDSVVNIVDKSVIFVTDLLN